MPERIGRSKRIVIKIGTSILTSPGGRFSRGKLARLCRDIHALSEQGREVVVVSSGAIGLGMDIAGLSRRPSRMAEMQACAAIGQGKLMHAYEQNFAKKKKHTAQVLLTREGLDQRDRFLRASQTLKELLGMKTIPIVNENDTVSTEEIGFGDNDRLSVHVAHLVHADLLILLSDVDGFFLKDGTRVRVVTSRREIDEELVKHIKDRRKEKNVGGMKAKLKSAADALRMGIPLLMVNGHKPGILQKAVSGADVGTCFMPGERRSSDRQMWISFSAPRKGTLVVDDGAAEALRNRKVSLLPSGMLRVRGEFDRGEVVELETAAGRVIGRGVARYAKQDMARLAGKKTSEIEGVLGYKYGDEAVHRNDLVIWG